MLDNVDEKGLMDDTGRRSLNESPAISMSYGRATVGYRPEGDSSPTIIEAIMEPGTADVVVFMICVTVIVLAAMGAVLKYLGIKKARSASADVAEGKPSA